MHSSGKQSTMRSPMHPCGSRRNLEANDETTLQCHRVEQRGADLCADMEETRGEGITAREVVERLNAERRNDEPSAFKEAREAFHKATVSKTGAIDSTKLGYTRRKLRNAPTPYGMLIEGGSSHKTVKWTVDTSALGTLGKGDGGHRGGCWEPPPENLSVASRPAVVPCSVPKTGTIDHFVQQFDSFYAGGGLPPKPGPVLMGIVQLAESQGATHAKTTQTGPDRGRSSATSKPTSTPA